MPFVIPPPVIDTPVWDTGEWPGLAAVEEALRLGQTVVGIDAGSVYARAAARWAIAGRQEQLI